MWRGPANHTEPFHLVSRRVRSGAHRCPLWSVGTNRFAVRRLMRNEIAWRRTHLTMQCAPPNRLPCDDCKSSLWTRHTQSERGCVKVLVMAKRFLFTAIAAGSLLAAASVTIAVSAGGTPSTQLPLNATYQPLPQDATTFAEISLNPLPSAFDSSVSVTPAAALATAEATTSITVSDGVTEITSLGSFTDSGLQHTSADGQRSLVADGTTAYVVTFSGLSLPILGPGGGTVTNDAVAVNAVTGDVIENVEFN